MLVPFLRSTDVEYDLIVVDAYHQPYVPFYLATREFFRLVRAPGSGWHRRSTSRRCGDDGARSAVGTTSAELPQVLEWPALRFNTIVLGLTEPLAARRSSVDSSAAARPIASLRELLARDARPVEAAGRAWTDDRAPVEWVTDG